MSGTEDTYLTQHEESLVGTGLWLPDSKKAIQQIRESSAGYRSIVQLLEMYLRRETQTFAKAKEALVMDEANRAAALQAKGRVAIINELLFRITKEGTAHVRNGSN